MPENDSFIANMSAVSFIRMMGELSGLPSEAALERAHEVLFYVGLGEARYRQLGTYSLGMKQLAKLAQAIVHGPKLLILDEPTNGLDPPARIRMIKLIKEMKDSGEMHLVLCSHLLRDVEETCEEVLILKAGRIVHYSNLEAERSANQRFVELETVGDDSGFSEALTTLGCECVGMRGVHLPVAQPRVPEELQHPGGKLSGDRFEILPGVLQRARRDGDYPHGVHRSDTDFSGPDKQLAAPVFLPAFLAHRVCAGKDERAGVSAIADHVGSGTRAVLHERQFGRMGMDAR
jgi:energy-coupling factor transporter ATP-binding protein EcfA2